ncbi:esterase-like activity of phytase family protein [Macromonas nakdongensis]|uniref:esterase-like activity of phytase family protein n=1 Tax=Macromonas nakdongensis TaxID=1843082 RepID=UPI000C334F78|nr:esterase-like activity of phytase family protein [Macromonas nakdongensis]
MIRTPLSCAVLAALIFPASAQEAPRLFQRIATFAAASNHDPAQLAGKKSVAEIVAATADGQMLAYTDSEQKGLGLVDLRDPTQPRPAGFVPLKGEPTSVVLTQGRALVAVDQTESFFSPQGELAVVDLASRAVVARCQLQGQPDSVALDASARHLVVVLENQRDETLNKGALPQLPGGSVNIIPLERGLPDCTRMHPVGLSGLAAVAGNDPEPEFVKVNRQGVAVVSLQENNHLALVDVAQRRVLRHFSAGTVDLQGVDTQRDGVIRPVNTLQGVAREPDAVAWLDEQRFLTANEGDYRGGSRGFTIFRQDGTVEYDSGALLEHLAMRLGHYPERRSAAKGNEPEGAEAAVFGQDRLFFVGSERASLVFVFRDRGANQTPEFLQALPTGAGPEGLLAVPQRDLFVVASETDGAARSGLSIYRRGPGPAAYPTLVSADAADGTPIPWGAISGAVADRRAPGQLWAVTDSAYSQTRLLQIDTQVTPALIRRALTVTQNGQPLALDAEGIAQRADGGFWIASEGDPGKKSGALDDLLVRVDAQGAVQETVKLPEVLRRAAVRFGLEGVAVTGEGRDETVWLAVQREWKDDPKGHAKILRYQPATGAWGVYHYPLTPTQARDGWVGMSEITAVGPDTFWVIERDNQFGDASFKTLQAFSVAGLTPAQPGAAQVPVLSKRLVHNLVPALQQARGTVLDKVESLAVDGQGQVFVITDNDGVDGSNGETQFLRLGRLR